MELATVRLAPVHLGRRPAPARGGALFPRHRHEGGLSAGNYGTITGASPATATRDLADMVAKGVLTRTGDRRHARYALAIPLRPVAAVTLDEDGRFD